MQLCEAFLKVRLSNCDTVERFFGIFQFCEGKVSICEGYNYNDNNNGLGDRGGQNKRVPTFQLLMYRDRRKGYP